MLEDLSSSVYFYVLLSVISLIRNVSFVYVMKVAPNFNIQATVKLFNIIYNKGEIPMEHHFEVDTEPKTNSQSL